MELGEAALDPGPGFRRGRGGGSRRFDREFQPRQQQQTPGEFSNALGQSYTPIAEQEPFVFLSEYDGTKYDDLNMTAQDTSMT